MPNWCDNKIVISGRFDEVRELLAGENGAVDFDKIVPEPEEFETEDGWYYWRLEHWGTKWNASTPQQVSDDTYEFLTAWSPSLAVTRKLSEFFPDVYFTHFYEEAGMDFSGYVIYLDGEVIWEEDGDFNAYWTYYDEDDNHIDRHDNRD